MDGGRSGGGGGGGGGSGDGDGDGEARQGRRARQGRKGRNGRARGRQGAARHPGRAGAAGRTGRSRAAGHDSGRPGRRAAAGADGVDGSLYGAVQNYMFNATTTPPPAAGGIRLNNATQNLATAIYLNYVTNDTNAINLKNYFLQRVKVGDTFYIQDKDAPTKWQLYELTARVHRQQHLCDAAGHLAGRRERTDRGARDHLARERGR